MSSAERAASPAPAVRERRRRLELGSTRDAPLHRLATAGSPVLLAIELAAIAIVLVELLPGGIGQDTWLAVLAGREVAQGGIPTHEFLTLFAYGHAWVDQQWFSQLLMYELGRALDVSGLGLVNVALLALSLVGAALAASRLGAGASSIARILPLVVVGILIGTEVRTQALAYPLFVAVVYLLASDSRRPSRAVYWCLPLLVLWGNIHGSATLGTMLVIARGLTILWERRRMPRSWGRPAALMFAPAACLLLNPYGISIVSYYRATLLNANFRRLLIEWQPITSTPVVAAAFLVLASIAVWSFGAHRGRTTLWERCALLALAAGAIAAVRNLVWFELAAVIIVPVSIDSAVRARRRDPRAHPMINLTLATATSIALIVALVGVPRRLDSAVARAFPNRALAAVRGAVSDQSLRVYADERFADWLLWRDPGLRGRVVYDARFELLSSAQLAHVAALKSVKGLDWARAAQGDRLLVLDPSTESDAISAFERQSGRRILYADSHAVVILRSARSAARTGE